MNNYTHGRLLFRDQGEPFMLHIAIKLPEGWSAPQLIRSINDWNRGSGKEGKPVTHPDNLIADISHDPLKEKIRVRLMEHPDEKWVIFSANTIGERADPPVRFRSL